MFFYQVRYLLRNLWRHRLYSTLNLAGLAIGMAAAMLIGLWVQSELRFDQYHRNAAHIWRVQTDIKVNDTDTRHWGTTPWRIHEFCAQTPGIQGTTQLLVPEGVKTVLQSGADLFEIEHSGFVGPGWFDHFDYRFSAGSARGFGDRPNDLILAESLAHKLFGKASALGAQLSIDGTVFVVHAVMEDPRPESSFRQTLILPLEAWLQRGENRRNDAQLDQFTYQTFVALRPEVDPVNVGQQLTSLFTAGEPDANVQLQLGALSHLHFDQSIEWDIFEKGNRRSVLTFALIGLLILLMASINYVSLTTARAHTRARETGIRKVVGAGKIQLFGQFLGESVLLAIGAGILAFCLVQISLPWFSALFDKTYTLPLDQPMAWTLLGAVVGSTVLLAGIYPALMLLRFQPIQVLRGSKAGQGPKGAFFRQGLVVAQFAISVALLICTIIISRQRSFMLHKDMGYEREQVFSFSIGYRQFSRLGPEGGQSMLKAFEQTLGQSAAVAGICRANETPVHIEGTHSGGSVRFDGLPEGARVTVSKLSADEHFADVFGIQMKEGRWFEAGNTADIDNVVLNETAARQLGLPQPWLGQRFGMLGHEGRVIGLVKDFHFLPLHEAITPLVVYNSPNWRGMFFVKAQAGQSAQALATAESIWKKWFPQQPFKFSFLDDDFKKMYRAEQQAGLLFSVFAGIAIFIACLGLFGLATFMAFQRTREIGIRKVLGASVAGITALLTKDFLKLVLVSVLIASPLAYYAMQLWLADFAYRISLQWWMFVLAGVLAVLSALLTVGVQSLRAAIVNPVDSLKND